MPTAVVGLHSAEGGRDTTAVNTPTRLQGVGRKVHWNCREHILLDTNTVGRGALIGGRVQL